MNTFVYIACGGGDDDDDDGGDDTSPNAMLCDAFAITLPQPALAAIPLFEVMKFRIRLRFGCEIARCVTCTIALRVLHYRQLVHSISKFHSIVAFGSMVFERIYIYTYICSYVCWLCVSIYTSIYNSVVYMPHVARRMHTIRMHCTVPISARFIILLFLPLSSY